MKVLSRRSALPRIALVSHYPPDHASFTGGVETATAALLEGLRHYQREFEFHVLSLSRDLAKDVREERDGFHFHLLGLPQQRWLPTRLPFRIAKVRRELCSIRPDLVHCQADLAPAATVACTRYPKVFTIHGVDRHEAGLRTSVHFWSRLVTIGLERFVLSRFDAYICISGYAASLLGQRSLTFRIPNPVSTRFFQMPSSPREAPGRYLLFVGVLAPLKRPADLLLAHAALRARFPDLETIFCGGVEDAGYARALRRLVDEQGIEGVRFLGHVSQAKLTELLHGATALVLPSAQENAPMSIAEAMAVGVPVVATRVGGVGEMVKHGETGLLYEAGHGRGLTECLAGLLADPAYRARLAFQARQAAATAHSPVRVAEATVEVYRRVLRDKSVSRCAA